MNLMGTDRRAAIVAALVEGVGIRATCRMTDSSKGAVTRLITELGPVCVAYQDQAFQNLPSKRLEVDEIWAFCRAKEKNVPAKHKGEPGWGDTWCFTALDADSKLIPSWLCGPREGETAKLFMEDLAGRLANRVQLTTDGHRMYLEAVEEAFGAGIDYEMLVKTYGAAPEAERRYSPAVCIGCERTSVQGKPDPAHVSTSYVERSNLSIRMGLRRYTRLTNAYSKKLANHCAALAIYFMHYNFARIHSTLRCSPAMAAGVTSHLWSIREIVELLPPPASKPRGPYKKRISK